jgi:CMP-N-acetylneuraminic acid synthetase
MPATDLALSPECKVVAFVHAKGTSERVPGKNLRILGDRPLICHAIANALAAKLVDAVVIDSEDDEILRVGKEAGAIPLKRPDELASNETTGDDLAGWQADNAPSAILIAQVVPTSPFILPKSIDKAVYACSGRTETSAIGMARDKLYRWRKYGPVESTEVKIVNSQYLTPTRWETTGLYVVSRSWAASNRSRTEWGSVKQVWLNKVEAIDINTEEDFEFAEIVWRGGMQPHVRLEANYKKKVQQLREDTSPC